MEFWVVVRERLSRHQVPVFAVPYVLVTNEVHTFVWFGELTSLSVVTVFAVSGLP